MIGLGTKALLIAFSGFIGVAGWASFSAPNWDPKDLWRITHNNKFYLSNCFNDPNEKDKKWTRSNLRIYLTVKGQVSDIKADTELELWAQGYGGKRIDKGQIVSHESYDNKSLQGTLKGQNHAQGGVHTGYDSTEHEFQRWTTGIVLGETGAGEDSQFFGDTIKCNNQFFDLKDLKDKTNYRWDKVTFKLKNIDDSDSSKLKDKYKGHNVYSIEIKTSETSKMMNPGGGIIKWADNFKPIVIV